MNSQILLALRDDACGLLTPTELWARLAASTDDFFHSLDRAIAVQEAKVARISELATEPVQTGAKMTLRYELEALRTAHADLQRLIETSVFGQTDETQVDVRTRIKIHKTLGILRLALLIALSSPSSLDKLPWGAEGPGNRERCLELLEALDVELIPAAYLHHAGLGIESEVVAV